MHVSTVSHYRTMRICLLVWSLLAAEKCSPIYEKSAILGTKFPSELFFFVIFTVNIVCYSQLVILIVDYKCLVFVFYICVCYVLFICVPFTLLLVMYDLG